MTEQQKEQEQKSSRHSYKKGWMKCPSCEKLVDVINHPEMVEAKKTGVLYHAVQYCAKISIQRSRLQRYGHSGARKKRQETYIRY